MLVEKEKAELEIAFDDEDRIVFNILDPLVTSHGLTRDLEAMKMTLTPPVTPANSISSRTTLQLNSEGLKRRRTITTMTSTTSGNLAEKISSKTGL
jgi:hypothetical protein